MASVAHLLLGEIAGSGAQDLRHQSCRLGPRHRGIAGRFESPDLKDAVILHELRDARTAGRVAQRRQEGLDVTPGVGQQLAVAPKLGGEFRQGGQRAGEGNGIAHRNRSKVVEHDLHCGQRAVGALGQGIPLPRDPERRRPVFEERRCPPFGLDRLPLLAGQHPPLGSIEIDGVRDVVREERITGATSNAEVGHGGSKHTTTEPFCATGGCRYTADFSRAERAADRRPRRCRVRSTGAGDMRTGGCGAGRR